jgi:para-nitrobenzyl esterase
MWSANVPMIIGTALDDAALALTNFDLDDPGLHRVAAERFGSAGDKLVEAYRRAYPEVPPFLIQARMVTDADFRRSTHDQADSRVAQDGAPVWLYRFDAPSNALGGKFGAVHGMDVGLVMHNTMSSVTGGAAPEFERLANQMASAWVAFARSGDPNTPLLPPWPRFDPQRRATMVFDRQCRVIDDPDGDIRRMMAEATA